MSVHGASIEPATPAARRRGGARDQVSGQARGKSALQQIELCSVRVAKTTFVLPIAQIVEIVGGGLPQPVPLAPGFVGGLVHYRGDVLTTVSLRHLLGLPAQLDRQDILVLECGAAGGCFGLLVDSVCEVLTVSAAEYEPNPSTLEERKRALFAGAYKTKDSLLILLDPQLLDPDRLEAALAGNAGDRRSKS